MTKLNKLRNDLITIKSDLADAEAAGDHDMAIVYRELAEEVQREIGKEEAGR